MLGLRYETGPARSGPGGAAVKAQVIHRRGCLWLKRPYCVCAMNRLGELRPCFAHFGAGLHKSRDYLARAWAEYEQTARLVDDP